MSSVVAAGRSFLVGCAGGDTVSGNCTKKEKMGTAINSPQFQGIVLGSRLQLRSHSDNSFDNCGEKIDATNMEVTLRNGSREERNLERFLHNSPPVALKKSTNLRKTSSCPTIKKVFDTLRKHLFAHDKRALGLDAPNFANKELGCIGQVSTT